MREDADALGGGHVEIDDAGREARADGELFHIDVGGVQHRAAGAHRHHGQRVRHGLGGQRRALERVEGDVDLLAPAVADLLADIEHRRLVALALADDDDAAYVEHVELLAHRLDGDVIGRLLVAAADQPRRRDRGRLGDPGEPEAEHPVLKGVLDHRPLRGPGAP